MQRNASFPFTHAVQEENDKVINNTNCNRNAEIKACHSIQSNINSDQQINF